MVRDNRYASVYLFGAICPARGVGAAMIMPAANTAAMNEHLGDQHPDCSWRACRPALRRRRLASAAASASVPANITLLDLPAYAPELNPMENVWEFLRGNKLCALVWDTYEASSMPV